MQLASTPFQELRLDRMSRAFGTVNALSDITLSIRKGEFIALLGPSGCGKSTALNCIAGLLATTGGGIYIDDKLAVILDLITFILQPQQQAFTYDQGYFYPGPAVKDVPISMAPKASQDAIAQYGRPQYADWIANNPIELPLEPAAMVTAFKRWDQDVATAAK